MLEKITDIPLWDYLKSAKKPILLYGMGNGADKIINTLKCVSCLLIKKKEIRLLLKKIKII